MAWKNNGSRRTENEIATVEAAGAEDVDTAMKAASNALSSPAWKKLPATDRGILMAKLATLMERDQKLLAAIDAWDNGRQGQRRRVGAE